MTIDQKLERSKSTERIDFARIGCSQQDDQLVLVPDSAKIMVVPVWTLPGDWEGELYEQYIREHPDYNTVYVRAGLLERLQTAAASLPENIRLVVRAGHRPIDIQHRLLNDMIQEYKQDNPDATEEAALEHARIYISDPAIKLPPHCCGSAIDVELYDMATQKLVDFGTKLNEANERSHLHNDDITPEQKANRMVLLTAMLEAGFSSYYGEWWHYSYGDQIWAWFYDQKDCLYGLVER